MLPERRTYYALTVQEFLFETRIGFTRTQSSPCGHSALASPDCSTTESRQSVETQAVVAQQAGRALSACARGGSRVPAPGGTYNGPLAAVGGLGSTIRDAGLFLAHLLRMCRQRSSTTPSRWHQRSFCLRTLVSTSSPILRGTKTTSLTIQPEYCQQWKMPLQPMVPGSPHIASSWATQNFSRRLCQVRMSWLVSFIESSNSVTVLAVSVIFSHRAGCG
jgi:hypothetical protein